MIGRPVRATVCLPTYNERENLESMVRALSRELREGDQVLVIDDDGDIRGLVAELLERAGFLVEQADLVARCDPSVSEPALIGRISRTA